MMNCNKCGNKPKETDKIAWKCTSCGKVYGVKLPYLQKIQEKKNSDGAASLLKCKECGAPLDNGDEKIFWKCSCGNVQSGRLGEFKEKEPEQVANRNNLIKYSRCGKNDSKAKMVVPIYKKYISIVLSIIACVCFFAAFTRVNNGTYKFYKEHYETCMEGYSENKSTANSYSGLLFKNSYNYIASSYESMANDDNKKIWEYRIQAIIFCVGGIICIIVGYMIYSGEISGNSISFKMLKVRRSFYIAMISVVILSIYYFPTRCSYDGCNEKRLSSGKYCYYHALANSYDLLESYIPKTGNAGALAKAQSYLNSSAFSYIGLIEQLEYSGFSKSEATYGADNCGANWEEQALQKAKSYLNSSAFSYSGLIEQLEYEEFTKEEATYGVDNCGADWDEQAAKKAKSYLESSSFTRSRLIEQLEYNGFTYEQAIFGVNQVGI